MIKLYKSNEREFGYNLASGGAVNRGYKLSDKTREKLSESHKGKSPWNKNKIGYIVPNARGKKRSEDAKLKMSENRPKSAVIQYDLNGNFIAEYPSQIEAERQTGVANANISMCCRGIYKTM